MRQFSRKVMYTCTALAAVILSSGGYALGNYKTVNLNIDGQLKEIHTIRNGKVADLLKWYGISVTDHDRVEPELDAKLVSNSTIWVNHAQKVTIQDGANPPKVVYTLDDTISTMFMHQGIFLSDSDQVSVRLDSPPENGQDIIIKRLSDSKAVTKETISFQTDRKPNSNMYKGEEKVISSGSDGLAEITTTNHYTNGKITGTVTSRVIVKQPQDRIVEYGTEDKPVVADTNSDQPVLLASRSASSFSSSQTYAMDATAYSAPGGRTALGYNAVYGVVAVDPSFIPLGTRLYIDGYGYAVAADTGSAIKGNRIDLCFNSNAQAVAFGRRPVTVHIVK